MIERIRTSLDALESGAVGLVAKVAPWLAPAPTAWLVYDRTIAHFGWPWPVAVAAGLVIEALGVAIAVTALDLWAYNRERPRKTDPPAPIVLPVALVAVYFLAAELLTVALDLAPGLAVLAPAVFPVLSLAGMGVLAVRADHARRLAEVAAGVTERKQARTEARRERDRARMAMDAQTDMVDATRMDTQWSYTDFARAASDGELDPAAMTGEQVAAWAGVNPTTGQPWSASTGRRWLRKWGNGGGQIDDR